MGWWPSSSGSSSKPESQQAPGTPQALPTPAPATPPVSDAQQPMQQHDADFHDAFPHLAPTKNPSETPETPASPPASAATHGYDPSLPTTMSCRAAFDSAFYCASFGGRFNDIYRYGQLRSCSEHWADWRFCMSLKSSSAEAKAQAIQARYREKDERMRKQPNSEDIWERRKPEEMIVGAFGKAEEEAKRVETS